MSAGYVVLRAPDFAFAYEGWWFNGIGNIRLSGETGMDDPAKQYRLTETHRFERRESDGATARVWEVVAVPVTPEGGRDEH